MSEVSRPEQVCAVPASEWRKKPELRRLVPAYEFNSISMAKCEEGYLCEVCGKDVESIADSDLYLRYVIGQVDPETLHTSRERHIRCNPTLAQFITAEQFEPVVCEGPFAKQSLDPEFVKQREAVVTGGWLRLQELQRSKLPIQEYPL